VNVVNGPPTEGSQPNVQFPTGLTYGENSCAASSLVFIDTVTGTLAFTPVPGSVAVIVELPMLTPVTSPWAEPKLAT